MYRRPPKLPVSKICKTCKEQKPFTAFEAVDGGRRVSSCLKCVGVKPKKASGRLGQYDLTEEAYAALLTGQDYKCAICVRPFGNKVPRIDHCHAREVVRGLLCHNCNVALGHFKDKKERLQRAIEYLEKSEVSPL